MELSTNLPYGSEAIQRHIESGASLKINVSSEADAAFIDELKRTDPERYNRLIRNMRVHRVPELVTIEECLEKLVAMLPGVPQLERRARRLSFYLSRSKRVISAWDYVFFSELTTDECVMFDDAFNELYPSKVVSIRKAGRPKKYLTPTAQKKANAAYQRKHRAKVLNDLGCKENRLVS